MRLRISLIAFCLAAVMLSVVPSAHAADVLHRLTHGDQYALALGTVVSASDITARCEVETVISGAPLPPVVRVEGLGPFMEMLAPDVSLEPGDYAVLSLNREVTRYTIAWGVFKVSSLDMTTLKVVEGPLGLGDLAAFQWYINSEGRENDFYFIGTNAYVRHADGTSTQLYPLVKGGAGVRPAPGSDERASNDGEEALATEWGYVLIAGLLAVAGCLAYAMVKARR